MDLAPAACVGVFFGLKARDELKRAAVRGGRKGVRSGMGASLGLPRRASFIGSAEHAAPGFIRCGPSGLFIWDLTRFLSPMVCPGSGKRGLEAFSQLVFCFERSPDNACPRSDRYETD